MSCVWLGARVRRFVVEMSVWVCAERVGTKPLITVSGISEASHEGLARNSVEHADQFLPPNNNPLCPRLQSSWPWVTYRELRGLVTARFSQGHWALSNSHISRLAHLLTGDTSVLVHSFISPLPPLPPPPHQPPPPPLPLSPKRTAWQRSPALMGPLQEGVDANVSQRIGFSWCHGRSSPHNTDRMALVTQIATRS